MDESANLTSAAKMSKCEEDIQTAGPSGRGQQIGDDRESNLGTTHSGESTISTEDEILTDLASMESNPDYRLVMINYMPLISTTMSSIASEWKINTPTQVWDIVDRESKKLIMVRYASDLEDAKRRYYHAKIEVPENCSLYLIEWGKVKGKWIDGPSKPIIGEQKVQRFLIRRYVLFESMNINTDFFKVEGEHISDLFPSVWLIECLGKWRESLLSDQFQEWSLSELYRQEPPPKMITPSSLIKYLDNLEPDSSRSSKLFYKGKIMPEHLVRNIIIEEREDSSCVDRIMTCLRNEMEECQCIRRVNSSEKSNLLPDILNILIKTWDNSSKSTFNFMDRYNCPQHEIIEKALGVGEKRKTFREYTPDMKQPEPKPIKKCIYPEWYEEVLCGLEEDHDMHLTHLPLSDLTTTPPTDSHPIAVIVEPAVSEVVEKILQSKAAVMTSKLTNMYSRLGGAYSNKVTETNKDRRNVAIFPLIAQMSLRGGEEKDERLRICSGIILRTPSHARKPTDRIGLITIEMLDKTPVAYQFCEEVKGAVVYECKNVLIIMRQNSVMKEDSSYNTFISNAMFIPINMIGGMTLEDPNISQYENMVSYVQSVIKRGGKWFLERYIEGLCFALLGNSRDEGYFAHLRKLFMLVFTWRLEKSCASFEIEKFCEKTNECLLDNPVSMHFHKTLVEVIKVYKDCEGYKKK